MNRRDLMKGILALSAAASAQKMAGQIKSSAPGHKGSGHKKSASRAPRTKFYVALRGPFAVVVQPNKKYGIQAFIPVQDNHAFFLNRSQQAGNSYHLSLPSDWVKPGSQIKIDDLPDFSDFSAHTKKWELQDYYITVDLPCPTDMLTDEIDDAVFKSGSSCALPLTHILEYDATDITQIKLKGNEINDLPPMNIAGSFWLFDLQVGLPLNTANSLQQAVDYYNGYLLPCFPEVKNKELASISGAPGHKNKLPFAPPATDVECKTGGLLVSFPQ